MEKGVNDSVLVMVGQKGRGPCDVNHTHELCSLNISNTSLAADCYSQWSSQTSVFVRNRVGGGSGGGASMLWPPDVNGRYGTSNNLPYIVSGGGGGTSVELNYTIFRMHSTSTPKEYYEMVINGKYHNMSVNVSYAQPGNAMILSPGAGGGYLVGHNSFTNGKSISQPNVFAAGGMDCAEFQNVSSLVPFTNVTGGFGGGGGACSGGGGGGGYTGGSVMAIGYDIPGEGGYSYRTPQLNEPEQLPLNEGNGYVDIVASDCGCAEKCVLDREEAMFDCNCTTSSSHLAPDGFDCFTGRSQVHEMMVQ